MTFGDKQSGFCIVLTADWKLADQVFCLKSILRVSFAADEVKWNYCR